jgi:hypothetical protein
MMLLILIRTRLHFLVWKEYGKKEKVTDNSFRNQGISRNLKTSNDNITLHFFSFFFW